MEERRYKTAYTLAKISEIAGWGFIVMGLSGGIGAGQKFGIGGALAVIAIAGLAGLMVIFLSQLTLIFIDTENNTRQALRELLKTNAMLAETLGKIAANTSKLASKEAD